MISEILEPVVTKAIDKQINLCLGKVLRPQPLLYPLQNIIDLLDVLDGVLFHLFNKHILGS